MESNQELEQRNDEIINKEQKEILKETFNVGENQNECEKKTLEGIIDDVIDNIKNDDEIYDKMKNYIKKYWFTKQIEEWKKNNNNNKNKEPSDEELMNIVKKDLKIRIANTMLALRQQDINQGDIWFYKDNDYVVLKHNEDDICRVLDFNYFDQHISPPYKPVFMKDKNDDNKLNGVCICKHGDDENGDDKSKTKWIMAGFRNEYIKPPRCKITFQTDGENKITNVEIETKKYKNSKSIYTISLNDKEEVTKITKDNKEENANNDKEDIEKLLYKDEINKVLIERIEDELDEQQKVVFDTIKKHIGIKIEKDNKKDEEKKDEKKEEKKEEIKEKEKEKEEKKENKEEKEEKDNKEKEKEKEENKEKEKIIHNANSKPTKYFNNININTDNEKEDKAKSEHNIPQYKLCDNFCENKCIGFDKNGNWHCCF